MHLGYNNQGHSYSMNNQQLSVTGTEEERDIGVCVARNLKPSAQCALAARTAQTVLCSELTRWKTRDIEQAETRSCVWTTPSH
jgi:hypothetical protein